MTPIVGIILFGKSYEITKLMFHVSNPNFTFESRWETSGTEQKRWRIRIQHSTYSANLTTRYRSPSRAPPVITSPQSQLSFIDSICGGLVRYLFLKEVAMEGGYKPWKTQVIIDNSPSLDSYGKPLPPPPSGYFWERRDDRSWELMRLDWYFNCPCLLDCMSPTDSHSSTYRLTTLLTTNDHSFKSIQTGDDQMKFTLPSVLEHVVMPGDTIQGICLRYRVSAIELRRHNNFSGKSLFHRWYTLSLPDALIPALALICIVHFQS